MRFFGVSVVLVLVTLAGRELVADKCRCGPEGVCCGETPAPPPDPFELRGMKAAGLAGGLSARQESSKETKEDWPTFASAIALKGLNGRVHCSATLVGNDRLLTAAHCLCYGKKETTSHLESAVYGSGLEDSNRIEFELVEGSQNFFEPDFCSLSESERRPKADVAFVDFKNERPLKKSVKTQMLSPVGKYQPPFTLVGFGFDEKKESGQKRFWNYEDALRPCPSEAEREQTTCEPAIDSFALVDGGRIGGGCDSDSGGALYDRFGRIAGVTRRGVKRRKETRAVCGAGDVFTDVLFTTDSSIALQSWFYEGLK